MAQTARRRPGKSKLVLRPYDSAFLQPVAHHVRLIPEINPRREGAAESRFQFGTSADPDERGAATFFCSWRSVPAKVVSEIDKRLVDMDQRLGRSPFGVNDVMAFEFDVEKLQFVALGLNHAQGTPPDTSRSRALEKSPLAGRGHQRDKRGMTAHAPTSTCTYVICNFRFTCAP